MAAQEVSSDTSIAQETAENKGNNGTLKKNKRVRQNGTLAQQLARMQAQMTQLTGLLEVQKKSEAPKLSGPAQELSTAAMARAMKTQKGEMR